MQQQQKEQCAEVLGPRPSNATTTHFCCCRHRRACAQHSSSSSSALFMASQTCEKIRRVSICMHQLQRHSPPPHLRQALVDYRTAKGKMHYKRTVPWHSFAGPYRDKNGTAPFSLPAFTRVQPNIPSTTVSLPAFVSANLWYARGGSTLRKQKGAGFGGGAWCFLLPSLCTTTSCCPTRFTNKKKKEIGEHFHQDQKDGLLLTPAASPGMTAMGAPEPPAVLHRQNHFHQPRGDVRGITTATPPRKAPPPHRTQFINARGNRWHLVFPRVIVLSGTTSTRSLRLALPAVTPPCSETPSGISTAGVRAKSEGENFRRRDT